MTTTGTLVPSVLITETSLRTSTLPGRQEGAGTSLTIVPLGFCSTCLIES